MSGWLRDLDPSQMIFDDENRVVVITASEWAKIDAYNFSTPTGPSVGRVYRRDGAERAAMFGEPVPYPHYIYVCVAAAQEGWVDHIPYEALVLS